MNVRIREINYKIRAFTASISDINDELFTLLPSDVYTEVINWVRHVHKEEWTKCRAKQQQKFARLVNGNTNTLADPKHIPIVDVSKEDIRNIKDRWVINKSEHVLSKHKQLVAISPNNIPTTDFITSVETACKIIGPDSEEAAHLRS